MSFINRLSVWTIFFNFFILIGAGHGIGWLGLIEFYVIDGFREGYAKLTLTGKFDDRLWTTAMIAALGQIVLFISLFIKPQMTKFKTIYVGLFLLFFSFFILTMNFFNSSLDEFSFWAGTPFLISAISLLVSTIKRHRFIIEEREVQQPT